MSVVYTARTEEQPQAGDDAAEARIFSIDALPEPIVFDHKRIIEDAITLLATGNRPDPMRDL